MCGIFAYHGKKKSAVKMVIDGLKSLEYRGYDSWGVAYKINSEIITHKKVGKISDFNIEGSQLDNSNLSIGAVEDDDCIKISMGHSRWATHGGVNEANAHPHFSHNKNICIVHNGIFENYLEIKTALEEKGNKFDSETDTEVIAHLVEFHRKNHNFQDSVMMTCREMEGRFAFVTIEKDSNRLIASRKGSPLIIGVGAEPGEFYIASDIPAFLEHTKNVIYLDDNQMVVIEGKEIAFYDTISGDRIEKRIVEIDLDIESAEKGEFPHFMIKEIMEQKDTLARAVNQQTDIIQEVAKVINQAPVVYLAGCGTAGKVCMVAEYLFGMIAKKPTVFRFGSEFSSQKPFLTSDSILICVSQSGETADTLEAIEAAQEKGMKVISIVNVESSTMARISDMVIPIKAGVEKAVASTKATTSQLAILTLLAYACVDRLAEAKQLLINTTSQINDMLNPRYEDHIMEIAQKIQAVESMYIIGRGFNYPMALEAAIKLQEVSYIHAEGFAGGELKHGPLALITKDTPVIALVSNDHQKNEIISNAQEVKARGGHIIGISPDNHPVFDFWIRVPDTGHTSPIVNIIPVQILAYQLAVLRQNDPDKPRNLAKSVTVK